jgi:parallel beta-helix repeat protein
MLTFKRNRKRILVQGACLLLVVLAPLGLTAADGRIPIYQSTVISDPGSYYLTQDFTVASGTAIRIDTNNVTIDLNGHMIANSGGSSGDYLIKADGFTDIRITNGKLVGGFYGVYLNCAGGDFEVDHLTVLSPTYIGICANGTGGGSNMTRAVVEHNRVKMASSTNTFGLYFGYNNGSRVTGNDVQYGAYGIRFNVSNGCIVGGNGVIKANDGISLASCEKMRIEDNHATQCTNDGITLTSCHYDTLRGNSTIGNTNSGIFESNGIGEQITGNTSIYNANHGIELQVFSVGSVTENTVMSNTHDGILVINGTNFDISRNDVAGNEEDGIGISDSSTCVIVENKVAGSYTHGIIITSTVSGYTYSRNILRNHSSEITDGGTNGKNCSDNCTP